MLDMRSVKSDDPVLAQCVHFTLVKIEKGIGIGIDPNHKMRELFTLNNTVSILVVPFKLLESIRELSTHVPKKVNTCNDTVLFNFFPVIDQDAFSGRKPLVQKFYIAVAGDVNVELTLDTLHGTAAINIKANGTVSACIPSTWPAGADEPEPKQE